MSPKNTPKQMRLEDGVARLGTTKQYAHRHSEANKNHLADVHAAAIDARKRKAQEAAANKVSPEPVTYTEKRCTYCHRVKPLTEFYRGNKYKDGHQPRCKKCHSAVMKAHNAKPSSKAKERERRQRKYEQYLHARVRRYGLTPEDYEQMHRDQHGLCAICGLPETAVTPTGKIKPLSVDHDAVTGQVRGLLCARCNLGIGYLQHDRDRLQKAIEYLWQADSNER